MSPQRLNFVRVEAEKPEFLDYKFELKEELFWRIIEVEMSVKPNGDEDNKSALDTWHCEVACIGKDRNSVSIFNIEDDQKLVATSS